MENVRFLFKYELHLLEKLHLSSLPYKFNKKVYWWMLDINHSIFDFYDKDELLADVQKGAYIVVDHSQDPCSFLTLTTLYLKELYTEFKRLNIPKKQIIIITPNPKELFLENHQRALNYVSFNSLFEITKTYAKMILDFDFYVPQKEPKKHFICLMRRDSTNRRLTNYFLHSKNIHHLGIVSHNRVVEGKEFNRNKLKAEILSFSHHNTFNPKSFAKYGLMKHSLSTEYPFDKGDAAHSYILHQSLSQDSLFEIISETDSRKNLFISEKTFKAIVNKNPFILLGNRYIIRYLKHLGFKTFHPIINEEYDNISDRYERFDAALKEAENLCSLSLDACAERLSVLEDICEYNYNHYLNTDWHFDVHKNVGRIAC